ncbi:MAG: nucleoside phosphorylase [Saprospiraceae bacterium]|nr:nucleoside phosphorylase [Saprospiraceae bacterium]
MIKASELILNPDGSVYHLNLRPGQIARKIITVGDQDRVSEVSKYFDTIEFTTQKREFKTTTGYYKDVRISVISTGIGTDNIDIVLNELDALMNIDLQSREIKEEHIPLEIYRIGTSGSMRTEVPVDSFVMSAFAIGLDNLLHYYKRKESESETNIRLQAEELLKPSLPMVKPYASSGSLLLLNRFKDLCIPGITVTSPGFYAPQGRMLRLKINSSEFLDDLQKINLGELKTTNFEMETSAIYGLANLMGHQAISLNAIIANRSAGEFSKNSHKTVDKLIQCALDIIVLD